MSFDSHYDKGTTQEFRSFGSEHFASETEAQVAEKFRESINMGAPRVKPRPVPGAPAKPGGGGGGGGNPQAMANTDLSRTVKVLDENSHSETIYPAWDLQQSKYAAEIIEGNGRALSQHRDINGQPIDRPHYAVQCNGKEPVEIDLYNMVWPGKPKSEDGDVEVQKANHVWKKDDATGLWLEYANDLPTGFGMDGEFKWTPGTGEGRLSCTYVEKDAEGSYVKRDDAFGTRVWFLRPDPNR